MASKKIFISPERRPAPHGKYWGMEVYEHDVCCEIAAKLKPILEHNGFEVYIAPPAWSMETRCLYANTKGYHYYMCIHTNASGNGKTEGTATGCECLYYNAAASIKANQLVHDELTKLYPSKRGLKDYTYFVENNLTKMVSCYPELAFHDNGKDARWIVDHKPEIAEALCKGVCAYFDTRYKAIPAEDKPVDDGQVDELLQRIVQLEGENADLKARLVSIGKIVQGG